ncbi:hypothetical protein DXG01_008684 [Tephrocybe rancida]|nr:hypothetical protein DXG01_008684 [Tephrocybe rancida]
MFASTLLLTLPFIQATLAAPFSLGSFLGNSAATSTNDATTALSQDAVSTEFLRPAQFSRVAYCSSGAVTSWKCGAPCESLGGGVEVLQAGGDDGLVPMYFIAHDPATESIIVAHQGTEPSNLLSIVNDMSTVTLKLSSDRDSIVNAAHADSVKVHDGFQKTFERTADGLLAGVQSGLASTGVSKVLVTGHSLGAAVAMMDAMMLHQELDPSVQITTTVFGLPRGGNAAWADLVDATLADTMTHMTNQNDPVPTLPPQFLDYRHPGSEVHIRTVDANGDATDVVTCAGQENKLAYFYVRIELLRWKLAVRCQRFKSSWYVITFPPKLHRAHVRPHKARISRTFPSEVKLARSEFRGILGGLI